MTTAATSSRLHLLGIRHHGPGSARSVVAALEAADPAVVLIEGPPDADAMIPFAASPDMVPPVALLVHDEADPSQSSFYPFAVYSPEWQAMRWALARGKPVRFIDLPTSTQLAIRAARLAQLEAEMTAAAETAANAPPQADGPDDIPDDVDADDPKAADPAVEPVGTPAASDTTGSPDETAAQAQTIRRDPLGYLSEIAGYGDSEAWWNALVEQGANAPTIFGAIETAMTELRAHFETMPWMGPEEQTREIQREAHMRLEIAPALKETEGPVAVVCGAWHVPSLRRKVALADDKAVLKGLPKTKVIATWVPWTDTRLATASGYGAGVASPGWYAHLWAEFERHDHSAAHSPDGGHQSLSARVFTARWQSRVAALLR